MDLFAAVPKGGDEGRGIVSRAVHGIVEVTHRPAFAGAPAGTAVELRLEELEDFPCGIGLGGDCVDERVECIYGLLVQFARRSETPFCWHSKTHWQALHFNCVHTEYRL